MQQIYVRFAVSLIYLKLYLTVKQFAIKDDISNLKKCNINDRIKNLNFKCYSYQLMQKQWIKEFLWNLAVHKLLKLENGIFSENKWM